MSVSRALSSFSFGHDNTQATIESYSSTQRVPRETLDLPDEDLHPHRFHGGTLFVMPRKRKREPEPTQRTEKGLEIQVPKRDDFFKNLEKSAKPKRDTAGHDRN